MHSWRAFSIKWALARHENQLMIHRTTCTCVCWCCAVESNLRRGFCGKMSLLRNVSRLRYFMINSCDQRRYWENHLIHMLSNVLETLINESHTQPRQGKHPKNDSLRFEARYQGIPEFDKRQPEHFGVNKFLVALITHFSLVFLQIFRI